MGITKCPHCGEIIEKTQKYYKLQTTQNYRIYYNAFYTEKELNSAEIQKYIKCLRNNEHCSHFVYLIEISAKDYFKYKSWYKNKKIIDNYYIM